MKRNKLRCLLFALSNSLVYSFYGFIAEGNIVVGDIWGISQYISGAVAIICIVSLFDVINKNRIDFLKTFLAVLAIISIVFCAFVTSSDLVVYIKSFALFCEIILIVFVLSIHYSLSCKAKVKSSQEKESKLENSKKSGSYIRENILKVLHDPELAQEEKKQIRSTLWIVICTCIILFCMFIIPIFLKVLHVSLLQLIKTCFIMIVILLATIYYKNFLYYKKIKTAILYTFLESIGIFIGLISEVYFNVYLGFLLNRGSYTTYFLPHLIMAIGTVPFMVLANKNIENCKMVIRGRERGEN